MVSPPPSTPSEGEIVESDSEKATKSPHLMYGNNVDRQSRICVSVSRSPSPYLPPRRNQSRTPSRSPYRKSKGSKRYHEDDHYSNRTRTDHRRVGIMFEDSASAHERSSRNLYNDPDRVREVNANLRYDDRVHPRQSRDRRPRTRSRSPDRDSYRRVGSEKQGGSYGGHDRSNRWHAKRDNKLPNIQPVSDRAERQVASILAHHHAKNGMDQTQKTSVAVQADFQSVEGDKLGHAAEPSDSTLLSSLQIGDEAMLIEKRRQKREAIKAKHRSSTVAAPYLASAFNDRRGPNLTLNLSEVHTPPLKSPSPTSNNVDGEASPIALIVSKESPLVIGSIDGATLEDEPSAADYDPTNDMQEDQMRHNKRHWGDEVSSAAYEEESGFKQDLLLPDKVVENAAENITREEFDMFAEEDELDMVAQAPESNEMHGPETKTAKAVPIPQAKALDMSMLDDWDDQEGYYKVILGELLDGRYHVQSNLGKGMFSGVVRATDQKTSGLVAIKLIRNNETMKKAGLKEIEILQKLAHSDPEDKKHIIRLDRHFEHKGHLCMVFENLNINLREVLKKFGRDVGINLKAVRTYAQQMFMGLSLLRKCNILHADLKPDNVLVNESCNLLKICDLGSASDATENEITPYLVSRFYRAPEIILGMPYEYGIDIWSVGCTLFELYTGKILFTGRSNNQMLRAIMECRGKFSHKILRRAQFASLHFDDLLNFRSVEKDRLSGKDVIRILNLTKPTRDLKTRLLANAKGTMDDVETKELNLFVDLLDRCLNLNPEKRCTPVEALKHPFITRMKG